MAMYESDHTRFMREWLAQHPQEQQVKQSGHSLWWNRPPQDTDASARLADARVPRKAYYYDVN